MTFARILLIFSLLLCGAVITYAQKQDFPPARRQSPPAGPVITGRDLPPRTATSPSPSAPPSLPIPERDPRSWQEFVSAEGAFSVLIPGRFSARSASAQTAVGPLQMHSFFLTTGAAIYSVAYNDYPFEATDQETRQRVYDGARDNVLRLPEVRLISERDIQTSGVMGREVQVAAGSVAVRFRYAMVGSRFYQVVITTFPRANDSPATREFHETITNRYLDSFRIRLRPNPATT